MDTASRSSVSLKASGTREWWREDADAYVLFQVKALAVPALELFGRTWDRLERSLAEDLLAPLHQSEPEARRVIEILPQLIADLSGVESMSELDQVVERLQPVFDPSIDPNRPAADRYRFSSTVVAKTEDGDRAVVDFDPFELTFERRGAGVRLDGLALPADFEKMLRANTGWLSSIAIQGIEKMSRLLVIQLKAGDGPVPTELMTFAQDLRDTIREMEDTFYDWRDRHMTYVRRHGSGSSFRQVNKLMGRIQKLVPTCRVGDPFVVKESILRAMLPGPVKYGLVLEIALPNLSTAVFKLPVLLHFNPETGRLDDVELSTKGGAESSLKRWIAESGETDAAAAPRICEVCSASGIDPQADLRLSEVQGHPSWMGWWYSLVIPLDPSGLGAPPKPCLLCDGTGLFGQVSRHNPRTRAYTEALGSSLSLNRVQKIKLWIYCFLASTVALGSFGSGFWLLSEGSGMHEIGFPILLIFPLGLLAAYLAVGCVHHLVFYSELRWLGDDDS